MKILKRVFLKLNARVFAASVSALCLMMTLSGLVLMNQIHVPKLSSEKQSSVEFRVETPRPMTQAKTKPPKPKKKAQLKPQMASLAGRSSFGLALFEVDFGGLSQGDASNLVMTEDVVDQPPRIKSRPDLDYPARALQDEIEGFVRVQLLVNAKGLVEKVKLIESAPHGVFDSVALNFAKKWTFEPALYRGQPVSIWVTQNVRFQL